MQTTFSQLYYPRLVPSEACLIHALNLSLAPVAQDEAVEVHKEETVVALDTPVYPAAPYGDAEAEPTGEAKEPQMMSKDEAREDGAVKWSIYNTYLRASAISTVLIAVTQLLGVGEKLCIAFQPPPPPALPPPV
ncbi:hypothetical protein FIBSPDRAFT_891898 [Athelia psychrophila]|uniref:Uncharacterized protein n=1 Tax=Athelia psychrophila TaxID=1759441 RepID=A0A166J868_9AGAM|nr:hypothetical protein FIBSPDRAFT_891898 [Fibularhizoctonia sp. CBS 109695]